MRKTELKEISRQLAVNREGLTAMLGCGRQTAEKIASEAGAVIHLGGRVLFNVGKIERYLDSISGTSEAAEST